MNRQILTLEGRTCLVTGAGQGVGRRIALHFAGAGARAVVVNDFRADRAEAVAEEVRALGGEAVGIAADVTDRDAVEAMVAKAAEAFGPVDILVNNAGNMGAKPDEVEPAPFWSASRATWDAFLGVNLYGVLNCSSAVLPAMMERKFGRLVTIVSDAGRVGEPGLEIYSAAKAGAAGFTRAVARTMGRHGVTANNIAIATTRTPGVADVTEDPERARRMLGQYVIRRFGEPEDIANMALFLASDAASWITGQTYPVNGGYSFAL
ncbi:MULTISPECIES: SDR family NAD(P)-dependent oxidoreductase [Sphingopyxis]|uniref:Short-chain dehydrogenase/reductase SDR n=1 Tax=Sphingopyxis granuli TaxID=267128 RepID=A0AA86GLQ2_9SPHN|nr:MULTISPECIES: SDR family oxidoreductase [Sphingopyxis]AMG75282.1 Short-chain dehydrogenase/reductase SDR [Sphingopyxis granuli]APW73120.1 oxidoreductase [Sphingopyxis granuli]ODU35702.1 MAG: oxidoreductase [Sphingopyxis sp. SCN 67-31]